MDLTLTQDAFRFIEPLADRHFLKGALYCLTSDSSYERAWSQQRLESALLFELLEEFEDGLKQQGIRPVRLKGASLVPRFYQDPGFRHLCDADVLIDETEALFAQALLLKMGFHYRPVVQWRASKYRRAYEFAHSSGLPLSLDIHTKIMWDQLDSLPLDPVHDRLGFWRLNDEMELLHLIVNWVEQDTCVSFNKMLDIYFYVRRSQIDFKIWAKKSFVQRHWRSLSIVQSILGRIFDFNWDLGPLPVPAGFNRAIEFLVDEKFLMDPRSNLARYFLVKHLTKAPGTAIKYDVLWALAHARALAGLLVKSRNRMIDDGQ